MGLKRWQKLIAWLLVLVVYALPTYWFLDWRRKSYVTFGAGLPWFASVIATKSENTWGQDPHRYIIFDTDANGAQSFAESYAGIPLLDFVIDRNKLRGGNGDGTWADQIEGIPWDLSKIEHGRFFQRGDTNGFLSIDMDSYRVYVFR